MSVLVAVAVEAAAGPATRPERTPDDVREPKRPDEAQGRELFMHSWAPHDPRSHGGDGLGPLYNASSCVACHSLGGPGGAGGNHVNVLTSRGAVLHRHGGPSLIGHLGRLGTRRFPFSFPVERNTPALFGAGLIDDIPHDVILANVEQSRVLHPEVTGRVPLTPEGRVARFGWKGDVADLVTFVSAACSVELGLEVPGSPQPGPRPTGLDLDLDELESLIAYVRSLPPPVERRMGRSAREGAELFDSIGCTACHTAALGEVDGLYSDLALHDMGNDLGEASGAGSYGAPTTVASQEWRTPPLWACATPVPGSTMVALPPCSRPLQRMVERRAGCASVGRRCSRRSRTPWSRSLNPWWLPRRDHDCRGRMKLIACIEEQDVARKILQHLGLPAEPLPTARAQAPPVTLELFPAA